MGKSFVITLLFACGEADNGEELDCRDVCDEVVDALCDRADECGALEGSSRGACSDYWREAMGCSAQRGTATARDVQECTTAIADASCADEDLPPPACRTICDEQP